MQTEEDRGPLSLAWRIHRPLRVLIAETVLGSVELQKLAEAAGQLLSTAPGLDFTFRVVLSAEGELPDEETLERLNAALGEVKAGWRFGGS